MRPAYPTALAVSHLYAVERIFMRAMDHRVFWSCHLCGHPADRGRRPSGALVVAGCMTCFGAAPRGGEPQRLPVSGCGRPTALTSTTRRTAPVTGPSMKLAGR